MHSSEHKPTGMKSIMLKPLSQWEKVLKFGGPRAATSFKVDHSHALLSEVCARPAWSPSPMQVCVESCLKSSSFSGKFSKLVQILLAGTHCNGHAIVGFGFLPKLGSISEASVGAANRPGDESTEKAAVEIVLVRGIHGQRWNLACSCSVSVKSVGLAMHPCAVKFISMLWVT